MISSPYASCRAALGSQVAKEHKHWCCHLTISEHMYVIKSCIVAVNHMYVIKSCIVAVNQLQCIYNPFAGCSCKELSTKFSYLKDVNAHNCDASKAVPAVEPLKKVLNCCPLVLVKNYRSRCRFIV
jgi:hypothetical protein